MYLDDGFEEGNINCDDEALENELYLIDTDLLVVTEDDKTFARNFYNGNYDNVVDSWPE